MSGEQYSPAGPGEHLQRMLQDWYYAPSGPGSGGAAGSIALPPDIIRVQLTDDWQTCDDGQGIEVQLDSDNKPQATDRQITLRDPLGIAGGNMLWDDQTYTMPAGTYLWAMATYDGSCPADGEGPYYEPLNFGQPPADCQSGSGSGSEGSGSEGSGSEGSGSEGPGSGSGGTCCNGGCATAICCPTDCSAAPTLKAAAVFSGTYTDLNFAATTLSREGCSWGITAGTGASVTIDCVNGGWVASVNGGTSTQWKSDPMHVGSPYPPSGTYLCDIYVSGDPSGGPVTVTISK